MDFETTFLNGSQLLQQFQSTLAQYAPDYAQEARQYEQAGEHIGTLSKKYTPNKYESFCRLADVLGASKSALSFRMEQLGLLDRNLLYKQ